MKGRHSSIWLAAMAAACGLQAMAAIAAEQPPLAGKDAEATVLLYAEGIAEDRQIMAACPDTAPAVTLAGWEEGEKLLLASLSQAGFAVDFLAEIGKRLAASPALPELDCTDPSISERKRFVANVGSWSEMHRYMLQSLKLPVAASTRSDAGKTARLRQVIDRHRSQLAAAFQCNAVLSPSSMPTYVAGWAAVLQDAEAALAASSLPRSDWQPLLQGLHPASLLAMTKPRQQVASECRASTGWMDYASSLQWGSFPDETKNAIGEP